jgi:hypothetical protein
MNVHARPSSSVARTENASKRVIPMSYLSC